MSLSLSPIKQDGLSRSQIGWLVVIVLAVLAAYVSYLIVQHVQTARSWDKTVVVLSAKLVPEEDTTESENSGKRQAKPATGQVEVGQAAVLRINSKYLFNAPPAKQFRNITGFLGDSVIFADGQMKKIGETYDGATIVDMGSNWVDMEFEGETITVGVYDYAKVRKAEQAARKAVEEADESESAGEETAEKADADTALESSDES